ncbi:hypothetical protein BV509_05200 [Rhodovulum sulfidophilum]|uniref:Uncharacterized protein n=1 Tax=Rhodovulum visakhapatnamense TaxID=364297 RepID=A0ABS1RH46_9RHOB|nr:hypothetical protein [Rhodovulum visakhapatnamense]MBL3578948.1 hypothetical protein [Rhodovulum visakhapatnamense]OLS43792.1 hypothetical protein BV509_05200 [Rhodovulum sulfidophilum]
MPETTPDRIEEIESLARHNCDELAGLTAELAELQARVEALEGGTAEAPPRPNCPRCGWIGAISREGGTDGDHA